MQQQQMFQIIKAKKLCRKTRESKIALSENGEFLTKNNKIAKTFNSFFETVTDSLHLFIWSSKINVCDDKFNESYSIFQTTLVFLKLRKNFNLEKDFLSRMFLRLP